MKIQIEKPESGDKFYNKKPKGISPCILGNNSRGQRDLGLNVLPNCVGWVVGRFNAIAGEETIKWLGNTNAVNLYALGKSQGLLTGLLPQPGALMVWSNGDAGHAAIVEEVYDEKRVLTSESEWNGKVFVNYIRSKSPEWRTGCPWMSSTYKFKGFVYQPKPVVVVKKLAVLCNGQTYVVNAINEGNENYIRMRDFDDVLHIADVCWNATEHMPQIDSL